MCKEGKLKKVKEFIGHCLRGKFQRARRIFQTMIDKGLEPDCLRIIPLFLGCVKKEGLRRRLVYFVKC